MPSLKAHLSDETLLLALDGELASRDEARVRLHLASCWACRTRKQELEAAITEFMQVHQRKMAEQIPPPDARRALLKASLSQLAETQRTSWAERLWTSPWRSSIATLGAMCALAAMAFFLARSWTVSNEGGVALTIPNPSLTPGAAVLANQGQVCRESNTNNKSVPVALRRRVFAEYGIRTADPSAYEIDYLITPALGGADDIHNLWPQSNRATVWNAQVKDELEDYLRGLVCDGQLDLPTAQREIATDWIAAYKKYFHTDRPLEKIR